MITQDKPTQRHRLIVLGASNVAKSLEVLLQVAPRMIPKPLDVFTAIGRGRSYGTRSLFLFRSLPGILQSDLWSVLKNDETGAKTTSVITDIGNDLLYDRTVDQITQWVSQCIDRLRATEGPIAVTGIPLSCTRALQAYKFLTMRTLMFPHSRLELKTVQERAEELDQSLQELAKAEDITFVEQNPEWYGFDPIHWKQSRRPEVWHTLLSALGHTPFDFQRVSSNFFHSMRHWRTRPAQRTLFGLQQTRVQPSIRRGNDLTVALY
ncbi:hypothetical protein GC197_05560 [bacterium]|nr:hypothetical protein [bacterium]